MARIVYEPTGAYHKAFERFMTAHGLPLSKVNPRLARRFAEAAGRLAKTDRIDAELLARFGALLEPRMLQANSDILNDLKELHVVRLALVKDRTAAKNRQKTITQRLLRKQNEARLKQIEEQLEAVDGAIRALIDKDAALRVLIASAAIKTIKGAEKSRSTVFVLLR